MHAPSNPVATLHLLCGKIGAGKSTLARHLCMAPGHVLISEDTWLASLFPVEIVEVADYVRLAARLRDTLAPHVRALLAGGMSVVLDVPFNTVKTRAWGRSILVDSGADHALHYLDVPDALCIARLHARNAAGAHPFAASDAEFADITRHFVAPAAEEGFNVVRHGQLPNSDEIA